jgi:2-iminobutanoate/2-iminopropanoate deaminase
MKRQIIRIEPLASLLEKYKAPTNTVARHNDTLCLTGAPPFERDTGEICTGPIERQTELLLEQMKLCLETAGSSLENVLKCNVYCTSVELFPRSTKSIAASSRSTGRRASSSTYPPGTAASTSRSTASQPSDV